MTLEALLAQGTPERRVLHGYLFAAVKNAAIRLRPELADPPPPVASLGVAPRIQLRRPDPKPAAWLPRWRRDRAGDDE